MKIHDLELLNMDCMEYLKDCEDNAFDLAIVDPPYFSGPEKSGYYAGTKQITDVGDYKEPTSWKVPDSDYFAELKRISVNQIIWGVNYYEVVLSGGRIVWLKGEQNSPFSQAEIAYQSFYKRTDVFKCLWSGFWKDQKTKGEKRIHPTQKPIALYDWLLNKYSGTDQRILDTHLGSGSSAIAAHYFGCEFTGIELDKDYFNAAVERITEQTKQLDLLSI